MDDHGVAGLEASPQHSDQGESATVSFIWGAQGEGVA
jgi:hypothetical protein